MCPGDFPGRPSSLKGSSGRGETWSSVIFTHATGFCLVKMELIKVTDLLPSERCRVVTWHREDMGVIKGGGETPSPTARFIPSAVKQLPW